MDKDKFLFLLSNSASLTEEETIELVELQDEFPYSQAIHNLVARGAQLNQFPDKQALLSKAAVYATDRGLLKAIVTAIPGARKIQPEVKKEKVEAPRKTDLMPENARPTPNEDAPTKEVESVAEDKRKELAKPTTTPPAQLVDQKSKKVEPLPEFEGSKLKGDELINELFHDLDKLKKLKHDFEVAMAQFDRTPIPKQEGEPSAVVKEKDKPAAKRKIKEKPEGIIAEIKSTKKKIKPSDPKQKEQLDIINQFIKSEPNIGKNKGTGSSSDTTDLSAGNSSYTDNIVSETLVEILIKQGKKEKAVEMLKKLIWKFPQKKAYFAAQIEELTS
ncbi:MAG TPA: hypothetical protein VIS49_03620 [Cyclobacteriaceae bacterium]